MTEELFEKYFNETYPEYDPITRTYKMSEFLYLVPVDKEHVYYDFKAGMKAVIENLPERMIGSTRYDEGANGYNSCLYDIEEKFKEKSK